LVVEGFEGERGRGLPWDDAVAEEPELGVAFEAIHAGDPPVGEAHHPSHEPGSEAGPASHAGFGGFGCGATEDGLPAGDRGRIAAPQVRVDYSESGAVESGSSREIESKLGLTAAPGEQDLLLPALDAVGVGSSCITAPVSITSPLDPRWPGEPFVPSVARGVGSSAIAVSSRCLGFPASISRCEGPFSDASGVGSRCSTSSARVGPCPPARRLSGCWDPPFTASCAVGVLNSGSVPAGSELAVDDDAFASVRGADGGRSNSPPSRVIAERGHLIDDAGHGAATVSRQQPGDVLEHEQPRG
jgi:hypothetical protein